MSKNSCGGPPGAAGLGSEWALEVRRFGLKKQLFAGAPGAAGAEIGAGACTVSVLIMYSHCTFVLCWSYWYCWVWFCAKARSALGQ